MSHAWAQFGGGHGGREPPFFRRGEHNMPCPSHFSLRFCIWRGFKTKCDKQCLVWFTDSDIFIYFYFKNDFSILQVSRDRKRLLTASVRHLSSVVYCKKGHCLETM